VVVVAPDVDARTRANLRVRELQAELAAAPTRSCGLRARRRELTGEVRRERLGDLRRHGRRTMGPEETELPKLAAAARRALVSAGYTRLEHLTQVKESEIMKLHGMGPNAIEVPR
jgi:hypothetical protein